MASLNNCLHCGSEAEFYQPGANTMAAKCTNQSCGITTPPIAAALDFAARDRVAEIWNAASGDEWPEWIQPTGAHDAYSKGAKVAHKNKHWVSNVDANVWELGVSAWTVQGGGTA